MKPRIMRMPLSLRLSLLFAASTAAVSLLAGVLFDRASEAHFVELDRQILQGRLPFFREALAGVRQPQDLPGRHPAIMSELDRYPDIGLRVQAADGTVWLEHLPHMPQGPHQDEDTPNYRELSAPLDPLAPNGSRLTLILDISHHLHFLQRMRHTIWLTMGLAALATALLGAWIARAGLRPLRRMGEVAAQVSAQSLTMRLDEARLPGELRGLAAELNAMLARLDGAFQRLSGFSADIAHELRTPLTALLTQTQVVLSRPRNAADYQEALHANLERLQTMTAMVNDMLLLAKADHGLLQPQRQALDMAELATNVLEFYAPLAEERGIALHRQGTLTLQGDRGMLTRVLGNLLDNALRHTADGQTVRVVLGEHEVSVENPGKEIPLMQRERLFDRFYRAEPSRQGGIEHAGLGLAICRSIVRAHGGEIRCDWQDGWVRFVMAFRQPA
jgi:two-component system heavy metal sensor histidine kinase CusS